MRLFLTRHFLAVCSCSFVLIAVACGDDATVTDAGADAGVADTGGGEDSGIDAGDDAGGDDAAIDSGMTDAEVDTGRDAGSSGSMITLLAAENVRTTFAAVDADDAPLTLDTLAIFQNDDTTAVIASVGSVGYLLDSATLKFTMFGALLDTDGAPVTPDLLFTGNIGGGERLGAVVGTNARLFDAATRTFEGAIPLTSKADADADPVPFAPESLTFGVFSSTPVVAALPASGRQIYLVTDGSFLLTLRSITACADGAELAPNLIASREVAASDTDEFVFVQGSTLYTGRVGKGFCLDSPRELMDQDDNTITPTQALGVDVDSDGTAELVFLH